MRRFFLLATILLAGGTAACTRIEPNSPAPEPEPEEVLVSKTFQAGIAETKTTLDGVSVQFAQGESISIYDGFANREFTADEAGSPVSFTGKVSERATDFHALSPYSAATVFSANGTTVTAATTLPSAQKAVAGSFADGLNMSAAQATSPDSFSLENVLGVAKITLSQDFLGGHAVVSMELAGAYPLAGDVTVTYGTPCTAAAGSGTVNSVTLSADDGSALPDGTYYFVVLPNPGGEITLTFTASDGYTATKTATLRSAFEAGTIKNLGTVKNLTWEAPEYVKVTSAPSDWTGDYLLVYEIDTKVLSGVGLIGKNSVGEQSAVEISSNQTISWEEYKIYNLSVEKDGSGYSLYLNGAGYLGWTSGNTLLAANSVGSDNYRWTISMDTEHNVLISNLSDSQRTIWYNPTATRFCAYTALGEYVKAVQIYQKRSSVSENPNSATVNLTTGEATDITSATATLNATYAGLSPVNAVNVGFHYGTSASALNRSVYDASAFTSASGSISAEVSSLQENTTYYYQVTMQVWDPASGAYKEFTGAVRSFTTTSQQSVSMAGWLELPAITGQEDFVGKFYSSGTSGKNRNYSYNYNYTWYASLWVAYPLCSAHTSGSASTSSWSFNPNMDERLQIDVTWSSYPSRYGASAYARGHQIPNADRKSNQTMNSQTYYVTNQTPQLQNNFNNGIWSTLEDDIRTIAKATDTVYVATGPVFRKSGGSETITYLTSSTYTPTKCPVPNYYWKALLKVKRNNSGTVTSASAIGFWLPHTAYSNKDYTSYAVSVDQIEAWTGFDLFANLPDDIEKTAEANTSWNTFQNF